jgi:hypothetical protein
MGASAHAIKAFTTIEKPPGSDHWPDMLQLWRTVLSHVITAADHSGSTRLLVESVLRDRSWRSFAPMLIQEIERLGDALLRASYANMNVGTGVKLGWAAVVVAVHGAGASRSRSQRRWRAKLFC